MAEIGEGDLIPSTAASLKRYTPPRRIVGTQTHLTFDSVPKYTPFISGTAADMLAEVVTGNNSAAIAVPSTRVYSPLSLQASASNLQWTPYLRLTFSFTLYGAGVKAVTYTYQHFIQLGATSPSQNIPIVRSLTYTWTGVKINIGNSLPGLAITLGSSTFTRTPTGTNGYTESFSNIPCSISLPVTPRGMYTSPAETTGIFIASPVIGYPATMQAILWSVTSGLNIYDFLFQGSAISFMSISSTGLPPDAAALS